MMLFGMTASGATSLGLCCLIGGKEWSGVGLGVLTVNIRDNDLLLIWKPL